jgi:hypothetical protein
MVFPQFSVAARRPRRMVARWALWSGRPVGRLVICMFMAVSTSGSELAGSTFWLDMVPAW